MIGSVKTYFLPCSGSSAKTCLFSKKHMRLSCLFSKKICAWSSAETCSVEFPPFPQKVIVCRLSSEISNSGEFTFWNTQWSSTWKTVMLICGSVGLYRILLSAYLEHFSLMVHKTCDSHMFIINQSSVFFLYHSQNSKHFQENSKLYSPLCLSIMISCVELWQVCFRRLLDR